MWGWLSKRPWHIEMHIQILSINAFLFFSFHLSFCFVLFFLFLFFIFLLLSYICTQWVLNPNLIPTHIFEREPELIGITCISASAKHKNCKFNWASMTLVVLWFSTCLEFCSPKSELFLHAWGLSVRLCLHCTCFHPVSSKQCQSLKHHTHQWHKQNLKQSQGSSLLQYLLPSFHNLLHPLPIKINFCWSLVSDKQVFFS